VVRLRVAVRQGASVAEEVRRKLARASEFIASQDKVGRWWSLDEAVFGDSIEVSAPASATVDELRTIAWLAVRDAMLSRHEDGRWHGRIRFPYVDGDLPVEQTLEQLGLCDDDTVELLLSWTPGMSRAFPAALPVHTPEDLFAALMLGSKEFPSGGIPRLWGALLYTDVDAELATYVRAHFDELNALSGQVLRIFVIERPARWSTALRYWRPHLERPLLRMFGTMRWLRWKPFDKHHAYDIARALDVSPSSLPCLALFRGVDSRRRVVFPIESVTPKYLRALFDLVVEAAGGKPQTNALPGRGMGPVTAEDSEEALSQVLRALPRASVPRAELGPDADVIEMHAFRRVAAAEQQIRDTLRSLVEPHPPVVFDNSRSVVSENFHFHGPTTFINRPVDSVIQDFQNSYGTVTDEAVQLRELLRLVLTSTALPEPDRTRAAAAVHEAARELPQGRGVLDRLKLVSEIVARASDIAAPAADIIGRLIQAFS